MNVQDSEDWFNPDVTTFGDRLTGARESAGMTQKDMARRLGVKLKTLKNWEDDLSEPRANRLSMMAGLLNVSLTWLISGKGEGPDGPGEELPSDHALTEALGQVREMRNQIAVFAERLEQSERALRGVAMERGLEKSAAD